MLAGTEIPEEVVKVEECTCRYTVTTRMTSTLRWAAMRAILMSDEY